MRLYRRQILPNNANTMENRRERTEETFQAKEWTEFWSNYRVGSGNSRNIENQKFIKKIK